MKAYRLYTVVPRLVEFIEQLTNCYVRLNRNRLKGSEGAESARAGENGRAGEGGDSTVCFTSVVVMRWLPGNVIGPFCSELRFTLRPTRSVGFAVFVFGGPRRCGLCFGEFGVNFS